jgi:hypothetical protein
MDAQPELLFNELCQLGRVQRGFGLQRRFESIDDLLGQLVRPLQSWTLWHQAP